MRKFYLYGLSVVLFTLLVVLTSCKKKVEQPTLPPSQTIQLNDDNFSYTNIQKADSIYNWLSAAITVSVWSTIVKTAFALPIIAYQHALNQSPQKVDNSTWLWQYNVQFGFRSHKVKLYGSVDPNEDMVSWEMYVDDFNWFVGENNLNATEGYWIFYTPDEQPKEKLKVEWTYNYSDSTGTAKYIVIDQNDRYYNSYLYYGNNLTGLYNCLFNIKNTTDTSSVEIQWNNQTKIGKIKSKKFFGDEIWHCWNENHRDCSCPASN